MTKGSTNDASGLSETIMRRQAAMLVCGNVHSRELSDGRYLKSSGLGVDRKGGFIDALSEDMLRRKRMMKVLIIDDDQDRRMFVAGVVESMGFGVLDASNGWEGLNVLAADMSVAMVLLDIDIPNTNGIEFLRSARKNKAYTGIKLLMVTIHSSMETVEKALRNGAQDYLLKPLSKEIIEEKFHALCLG